MLLTLAIPAGAVELGGEAPPLKIEKWVKGKPVDLSAGRGKHIYVIDFWATWCGPCIRGIPKLTALQKKYADKGVVVIGVSADEGPTRKQVEPMVKAMGDKMAYTIGMDKNGGSWKAYMEPFKVETIPHAFVVDKKGKLVWQGYPGFGLEEIVAQVVAGDYDTKRLAAISERKEQEWKQLLELFNEYFLLIGEENARGVKELGKKLLAKGGHDPDLMNQAAWTVLTSEMVKTRDLQFALKASKAAFDATKGQDASIVDTYARALFETGDVKGAIRHQKKAIELLGDNKEARVELEKTLRRYENAAKT
jgi:thiol-disulfide isomerase/thioredoxin